MWLKTGGLFGYSSVRGMLSCVSTDLPATHKLCGLASHSATMGCSECYKSFPSGAFGDKKEYSGYDRQSCNHAAHLDHPSEKNSAKNNN